jgi:hypothetical protein
MLEGGMITIHLKIYGTIIDVEVEERTRATVIYNLVAARMNLDPSSLSIQICRIGNYVEGMGHVLTENDFIWDGVYNFE